MPKSLFVSRGRTVVVAGDVHRGPGELVTLPDDEAARLVRLGFLQDTPPEILPPPAPNPASIGLQVGGSERVQGPKYS